MQHDAGNAFPGDPQHAALLSLFNPPGGAAADNNPEAWGSWHRGAAADGEPPRLPDGTAVHVSSPDHFEGECDGVIREGEYDGGWLYRIEVTGGDRLDAHRTPPAEPRGLWNQGAEGELWVCDFEVSPINPAAPTK